MGNLATVINAALVFAALASPFFFTAGFSIALALVAGAFVPITPFLAGILADTLYWSPSASMVPWYTLFGALASLALLGSQRFIRARIMHV